MRRRRRVERLMPALGQPRASFSPSASRTAAGEHRAALIRVHLAEGNQSKARGEFERYQVLLHAELGLAPTSRLRHLARRRRTALAARSRHPHHRECGHTPAAPALPAATSVGLLQSCRMCDDADSGAEALSSDRTGLMIIRVWTEQGSSEPLRAQLRVTNDVSAGFDREVTFSRPEAVCTVVAQWLEDIMCKAQQRS